MRRREAFTLIELLVVIAIIAILAAMLFPVFARARESARKIQCLSNVKNIAMAVQMYLTDYDRFPPEEHRQEAIDFFVKVMGCSTGCPSAQRKSWAANPYLRWPVVLDEYTKNRDVYQCPSAKLSQGAFEIMPTLQDWLKTCEEHTGDIGTNIYLCHGGLYPQGWGGDQTDSFQQHGLMGKVPVAGYFAIQTGPAFVQQIGFPEWQDSELKTATIGDAARFMVVADMGAQNALYSWPEVWYPDTCMAISNCWADWVNCPDTEVCGAGSGPNNDHTDAIRFWTDASFAEKWTRHLGGVNLGFADGHAQWFNSRDLVSKTPHDENGVPAVTPDQATIQGIDFSRCPGPAWSWRDIITNGSLF
jgi:prepilin-type N-terminal cleavage/methylation domain-containing protein/prepilin-type processing-associated H-X9-DG protein